MRRWRGGGGTVSIHPNQGWGTVLFWLHCNSPTSSIPQHRGPHGPPERNRGVPSPPNPYDGTGWDGPPPNGGTAGRCSALGCGVGAALAALLPAQGFDPRGAGAGGEARQGQGAEAHVLPRHDELPKTLLVGEGVTGAPRPPPAAPTAGAAVLGLLLLAHQLGVAHLETGGGGGVRGG